LQLPTDDLTDREFASELSRAAMAYLADAPASLGDVGTVEASVG